LTVVFCCFGKKSCNELFQGELSVALLMNWNLIWGAFFMA